MEPHANGVILGAILQALPQLLPIILQILGAARNPTPTQKHAARAAVMDHLKTQFDLQTLIDNLPAIEAAVEQILKLAQTFTQPLPAAHFGHHYAVGFRPHVDASTIQTDLQNLQAAQATLSTDTEALATAQTALTTAQQDLATAQTAVAADKANITNLVDQAIADIKQVYALS